VLQAGGEGEPRGLWPPAALAAPAITGALAIAAALAVVGIVAQAGSFTGASFGDRVVSGALSAIEPMGLVLAVAVALRWSESASDALASRPRLRDWAYASMRIISLAIAAASCWAFVDAFIRGSGGDDAPHLMLERFALASVALAPLSLAAAVMVVTTRARGRIGPAEADDAADEFERDVFADGVVGPTVGCLLGAGLVSVAIAVNQGFLQGSASFWDRVVAVSIRVGDVTTAFLAFAVVVLVVLGYRHRARSNAALRAAEAAGLIGAVVAVGGAYAVCRLVAASSHSPAEPLFFYTQNWWNRFGRIAPDLAAAVIGIVVLGIARQLRKPEIAPEVPPWAPPEREPEPRSIVRVSRTEARTVATMLAVSTAAYAVYTALAIAGSSVIAIDETIVEVAPFILTAAGLALAAALVMSASRPDATGRDTVNSVFDGVVGVTAVAALAVSGYSICFALLGHHDGRFSVLAHASKAERFHLIGPSIAAVLIAAAAIHLIVRGRQLGADRETDLDPDREVEALDLLS
jgi:hypothetical protein